MERDRRWRDIFERTEALKNQRLKRMREMELRKVLETEKQRKIEIMKRRAIRAKIRKENKIALMGDGSRTPLIQSHEICVNSAVVKNESPDSSNAKVNLLVDLL